MMLHIDRDLVVRFIIGFSLTIGAWIFFAQPRAAELERLEKSISEFHNTSSALGITASEHIASKTQEMRLQLDEISKRNSISRDSSILYVQIKDLAKQYEVIVQQLQPTPESPNQHDDMVSISKVDITVQGEYERIALFIDSLKEFGGRVRPYSVHIGALPSQAEEIVNVRMACDVISFELPQTLVQMQENINGDT